MPYLSVHCGAGQGATEAEAAERDGDRGGNGGLGDDDFDDDMLAQDAWVPPPHPRGPLRVAMPGLAKPTCF